MIVQDGQSWRNETGSDKVRGFADQTIPAGFNLSSGERHGSDFESQSKVAVSSRLGGF
jgi:hypothetical protein